MSQFKAPDTLRERARERPFLVAEEFAFQEAGWDGGAIECDQGVRAPRAAMMNRTRDQFLSSTGLSLHQHRRAGRSDGADLGKYVLKSRAAPDDVLEDVLLT